MLLLLKSELIALICETIIAFNCKEIRGGSVVATRIKANRVEI